MHYKPERMEYSMSEAQFQLLFSIWYVPEKKEVNYKKLPAQKMLWYESHSFQITINYVHFLTH